MHQLNVAFAGADSLARMQAILALAPDDRAATKSLRAALEGASGIEEVCILDALVRIGDTAGVEERLIAILDSEEATGDGGEELYMMARTALHHLQGRPDSDEIEMEAGALSFVDEEGEGVPVLGVVVHGTWACDGCWWRDRGDFHTYLRETLGLRYVYAGDEPFVWSGRNRDAARMEAALSLNSWVRSHNPARLEVFAHSHGANVSMLATRGGLRIDKLVMLSPPVRADYFADWSKVGRAYNVQASFDPVVGIARGGQWFNLDYVKPVRLAATGHGASHDPEIWEAEDVAAKVDIR